MTSKKLIGLRLDEAAYQRLEAMAKEDFRSIAGMAEILFFRGLDALTEQVTRDSKQMALSLKKTPAKKK